MFYFILFLPLHYAFLCIYCKVFFPSREGCSSLSLYLSLSLFRARANPIKCPIVVGQGHDKNIEWRRSTLGTRICQSIFRDLDRKMIVSTGCITPCVSVELPSPLWFYQLATRRANTSGWGRTLRAASQHASGELVLTLFPLSFRSCLFVPSLDIPAPHEQHKFLQ
jgi:hypothetical protein